MPPESLFGIDEFKAFVPAPDVASWVEATFFDPSSPVANPEHEHLANAHIGYLWTMVVNNRKGKRVIGQCETGSPQGAMGKWSRARAEQQVVEWFGSVPDFIITLDAEYCRTASDVAFAALVEHELMHCGQERDEFGTPKFSKSTGLPVYTIRGHDFEGFIGIAVRYGAVEAGVKELFEALSKKPLFSAEDVSGACGTCQARKAA
ncbi:putative metallopeptidase [Pararhizobium sp. DWP1-1-3]|uniref:putative metallopeptidase n=1 Tax=Pararhizobium sp. DWP1-1-3 TaxID=2804652 RepID=UPI003CF2C0B4